MYLAQIAALLENDEGGTPMKNTKTATPNADALIDYIMKLTPAQCDKLVERLPLLKQLAGMTENELVFAETFLGKVSA